jgi:hypothetical protein
MPPCGQLGNGGALRGREAYRQRGAVLHIARRGVESCERWAGIAGEWSALRPGSIAYAALRSALRGGRIRIRLAPPLAVRSPAGKRSTDDRFVRRH